jgi:hypothetical protein
MAETEFWGGIRCKTFGGGEGSRDGCGVRRRAVQVDTAGEWSPKGSVDCSRILRNTYH